MGCLQLHIKLLPPIYACCCDPHGHFYCPSAQSYYVFVLGHPCYVFYMFLHVLYHCMSMGELLPAIVLGSSPQPRDFLQVSLCTKCNPLTCPWKVAHQRTTASDKNVTTSSPLHVVC